MTESVSEALEATLIKVPFDSLKRTTRERKYLIDELKGILAKLKETASAGDAEVESTCSQLSSYLASLQSVKRKFEEVDMPEEEDCARTRVRLLHLQDLGKPMPNHYIDWNRGRIDRILVDYMLRRGHISAAEALESSKALTYLTDVHIFKAVSDIMLSLKEHDCSLALRWCKQNASRLSKHRSILQFQLHVQEFVELVRQKRTMDALSYAQKNLAPLAKQRPMELQRTAALLAFPSDTQCEPYASMFSLDRWDDLLLTFKMEVLRLHGLPRASMLEAHLQAGLSSLKSSQSLVSNSCRQDPMHLPSFRHLSEGLPSAKHVHSKLVCAITGKVMSEHNPPLVLPNGYVYSTFAMESMAAKNKGIVRCPMTGDKFNFTELRRAFVM